MMMRRIDESLDACLLIAAVRIDDPASAASALDAGVNPDTCADGYPLLCLAAAAGHRKVLDLLLRAGASPHLLDTHMGASALHKAAQSGVVDIAKALLAHGAFIDLQAPTHGHTPLIDAVLHRKSAMVDFLVDAGSNVFISARGMLAPDYTALDLAKIRGDRHIVEQLQRAERTMRQTASPALHVAVAAGDGVSVARLLDAGADPNEPARVVGARNDGQTPLHIAARDGQANIAAMLSSRGARANVFDHFMRATPGHKAAALGHPDLLRIMREHNIGLNLEAKGPYNGYTALHDAVWWGHPDAVKILLGLGASRDARGLDGRTPMDIAVQDGQATCLAVLLDNTQ
jgi:uncharacterized protein